MKVFFDIDGVLTPKQNAVKINTVVNDESIRNAIINADPSPRGFALLNYMIEFLTILYGSVENAVKHIFFPTGRKKSEYEVCTRELFGKGFFNIRKLKGLGLQYKLAQRTINLLMDQIIWYPEEKEHTQAIYFETKYDMINQIVQTENEVNLYFEDDQTLINYISDNALEEAIASHFNNIKMRDMEIHQFDG